MEDFAHTVVQEAQGVTDELTDVDSVRTRALAAAAAFWSSSVASAVGNLEALGRVLQSGQHKAVLGAQDLKQQGADVTESASTHVHFSVRRYSSFTFTILAVQFWLYQ